MKGPLLAGWVAVYGTSAQAIAAIAAIAATGASSASAGDIISAGSSVSAAGALIYIVKKMTDGQLVARDPARVESQVVDLAESNATMTNEAHKREDRLHQILSAVLAIKERP